MARGLRAAAAALTVLACASSSSGATAPPAAAAVQVQGVVRDVLGGVVVGASVLVAPDLPGATPVAAAVTNDTGRYLVAALAPGPYRVAVFKDGFLPALSRIDTSRKHDLDIVVRPTPEGAAPRGGARDWVLRLPRRSVLRETDAASLLADRSRDGGPPAREEAAASLRTEIQQQIGVGISDDGSGERPRSGQSSLKLSGSLGSRGRIVVKGRHERVEGLPLADTGRLDSLEASRIAVDFDLAAGTGGMLAMRAYWDRTASVPSGADVNASWDDRQSKRVWGYGATWSSQLGPSSRLDLEMDYQDAVLDGPANLVGGMPGRGSEHRSGRAAIARGTFRKVARGGHDLSMAIEGHWLESTTPFLRAPSDEYFRNGAPTQRWALRADAEDRWAVSGPLSLIYGVTVRRAQGDASGAVIEPRVGGAWRIGTATARAVVSYDVGVGRWAAAPESRLADSRSLGYEARVDLPLPAGYSLAAELRNDPLQLGGGICGTVLDGGRLGPVCSAQSAVASRLGRVTLERQVGRATVFVQYVKGTVRGVLAEVRPRGRPLEILASRSLVYRGGRAGLDVAESGTRVSLEVRVVRETSGSAPTETMSEPFRIVDLHLEQDLARFGEAHDGIWRFLLDAQIADEESPRAPHAPVAESSVARIKPPGLWVNAGFSVLF